MKNLLFLLLLIVPIIPVLTGCSDISNPSSPEAQEQGTAITGDFDAPNENRPQLKVKFDFYDSTGTILQGTSGLMAYNLEHFPWENIISHFGLPYTSSLVKIQLTWYDLPDRNVKISNQGNVIVNKDLNPGGSYLFNEVISAQGGLPYCYLEFKLNTSLTKVSK